MGDIPRTGDDFLNTLKTLKLELMPRWEVQLLRLAAARLKSNSPPIAVGMKLMLDNELIGTMNGQGHAKDKLAVRLFKHYLYSSGDFTLNVDDMRYMNTADPMGGSIDLRYDTYEDRDMGRPIRSEWNNATIEAMFKVVPFSGHVHWGWDNGAISTYRVNYDGMMRTATELNFDTTEWTGRVNYFDRFDLDPRWTWSPADPQGRSASGERRTRIGFILDLGTDFDIKSPWINAKQGVSDKSLVLLN